MTEAQTDRARRAVECKGWRWRCGMFAALDGIDGDYRARVCRVEGDKFWSDATTLPYELASYVPDLRDPATLGCLLALVREAWSDPYLCAVGDSDTGWRLDAVTAQVQDLHGFPSEAEALVSALEWSP